MGSEMAPEFIYGNGLSYPAAANYYGYYCTGVEAPGKWDGHHNGFGLDGQDLHFSADGSQNVYYTSDYGYSQYSYNPYSHGSAVGFDGSLVGTQQYFADPTYHQPIPSPSYIPIPISSGVDIVPHGSPESLVYTNYGYVPSKPDSEFVIVPNTVTSSTIPVLSNLLQQHPFSASRQFDAFSKQSEGPAFNLSSLGQSLSYGAVPSGRFIPHVTQPSDSAFIGQAHASKQSAISGLKHTSDLHKPTNFQSDNFSNGGNEKLSLLDQQGPGARANRARGPWNSRIAVKAYTSKVRIGNLQGIIIIDADQYNKDDFPVDYPRAKFFVVKSYSEDDVHKSIKYNVWSSTPNGNNKLNTAYEDAQRLSAGKPTKCPVFLFFSVNGSGHFCGVAEMVGPVNFEDDMDFWQQDKWTGSFPVKWHIIKDVPNTSIRQILLENNENKPVTHSRDTQEITHVPGSIMLKIFKSSPLKESILDDFMKYEELEKKSQKRRPSLLSYDAPIFVPSFASQRTNFPSDRQFNPQKVAAIQHNGYFNQSLQSDERQLHHLVNCSLGQNEKPPNAAVHQSKAHGMPMPDVCTQAHKVDRPQTDARKESGVILQPAKADNKADKPMERGDQKQPNAMKVPVNGIEAAVQTDDKSDHKLDQDENLVAGVDENCPVEVVTVGSMHVRVKRADAVP